MNDIAIKYRITSIDESLRLVRAFFAFGKRAFEDRRRFRMHSPRVGVSNGSASRDAALAFTLDAMDFWRSENGVYGLVAIQD